MKVASSLFSSVLIAITVGACAMAPGDADEAGKVGRVSQAICKSGVACMDDPGVGTVKDPPPSPKLCKGALCPDPQEGGDTVVAPPPPEPWVCPLVQSACGPVLVAVESDTGETVYECREGCPGGGIPTHVYNPCPLWYPRYVCSPLGKCQCI